MDRRGTNLRRVGAAAILSLFLAAGCVERRYTIRTDPPGALVVVNGQEIGTSPVSKSFVYYGDRDIRVYKDGFRTERFVQPLRAPWWDNYLTEFFTENLVPITLRDEREYVYKLSPETSPTTDELAQRAEDLRAQGQTPPEPRRGGLLGWFGF
ncbi:MAG: PEGA domain-containing protein [Isosphaeraceae bacterium]